MSDKQKRKALKRTADRACSVAPAESKWVHSMHEHFQKTGFYRADDLNKLLGDPRDGVGVSAVNGAVTYSFAAK